MQLRVSCGSAPGRTYVQARAPGTSGVVMTAAYLVVGAAGELVDAIRNLAAAVIGCESHPPDNTDDDDDDDDDGDDD